MLIRAGPRAGVLRQNRGRLAKNLAKANYKFALISNCEGTPFQMRRGERAYCRCDAKRTMKTGNLRIRRV
jgi:hypothetical protein